jgi:hypothetical protein
MYFTSPSGHQSIESGFSLTSGTDLNGTWTGSATIPAYSEAGTWIVEYVLVFDYVGNTQYYFTSDLTALGFPTALQVTSNQDTQPPVLTSFTFSPMAVNTTTSWANVNLTAQITDNLSGASEAYMYFSSPSGHQSVEAGFLLVSGTDLNGTWAASATIPAYSEAGTWIVDYVLVFDNAGNTQYYYTSDLTALGFPTNLQVTSNQDTQPPVLTSFTFSPMAVNTTTTSATVNLTAQITDNLSGASEAYMYFTSPSGHQSIESGFSLTSGTALNGTWTGSATIPAYSEAGTWVVAYVLVFDYAGNTKYYYTSDLTALGFPTQLIVDSTTTVALASSNSRSPYGQPITFRATVTSSNGNIPTGTVNFDDGSTVLGSGTLNSGGVAFFTTSTLTQGARTIVVAYLGDSNDPAANSAPLTQIVNPARTTTSLTSSLNPSTFGQIVTFSASVSFANGIPPNGDPVEFYDGQTKLGTGTVTNGVATFSTTKLAKGSHQIQAKYLRDPNLTASKSNTIRQQVTP